LILNPGVENKKDAKIASPLKNGFDAKWRALLILCPHIAGTSGRIIINSIYQEGLEKRWSCREKESRRAEES
jgi:hypothetical protein